jgi:type I restriction enzyme R subunit
MAKSEAKARIKINKLLEESGWRFFDSKEGKANIVLEPQVTLKKSDIKNLGNNFEKTKKGFIDFLFLDKNGYPLVILEAKKEQIHPLSAKEQARKYARSLNVRFVILSNGNLHYFWDIETGNPEIITSFPKLDSIKHKKTFKPDVNSLVKEKVDKDYITLSQYPQYLNDPAWKDKEEKKSLIEKHDLHFLRPYQLKAIHSIQQKVQQGHSRFLFEMATGTGKTLVSAAIIKLFLKTGNCKRVLFLVDRIELENQAYSNFKKYLKNEYHTAIYKESKDDWRKAEVVISTVQSLLVNNRYQDVFSPTDFDLVISDEAHRSISGNNRAVFEYFIGYKLGLTATPKDYLKSIKADELDPRQLERRQLLDTYKTFGCERGDPTFKYSLIDGVKDGYLVTPTVIDARTEITTKLLSDEGYAILKKNEEGELEEQIFYHRDFEKKFFSEKTNRMFIKTFFENALHDPISGEIGKTIIFCVSQNHALKITQILNEYAHQLYPNKYKSDFAIQITSWVKDAQAQTIKFTDKNNNLGGRTKILDGYLTSKTRVCITVGMMTTGYDCKDILNLCLLRPIFSPTDFVQIKGRGTRKFSFSYTNPVNKQAIKKSKKNYLLFDFFANCEYFEDKFDYDEVIKLPPIGGGEGPDPEPVSIDKTKVFIPDPLKTLVKTPIGLQGMKVDRQLFQQFEEKVKGDEIIRAKIKERDYESAEEYLKNKILNQPKEYFTLEKIKNALNLDRRIKIRELLELIFGKRLKLKNKNELLEDEFAKFISIQKPQQNINELKNFFKAYTTDGEIRNIIDNKDFTKLYTNPKLSIDEIKSIGKDNLSSTTQYIKDYVNLNTFLD